MVEGTNIGGSAFEAHVASAARAIENGDCEVALITFGSLQRSQMSRTLGGRPAIMSAQYETPWGMPTPIGRSEEHTSELQSLMRISYAVFCLKKKKKNTPIHI